MRTIEALATACPPLARVSTLASEPAQLLDGKDPNILYPWLAAAEQSDLGSFAAGIRRAHGAVLAAVIFAWSDGQVQGQLNRVKGLERAMYARASFALLRKRVLMTRLHPLACWSLR